MRKITVAIASLTAGLALLGGTAHAATVSVTFTAQGEHSFRVPAGVTSLTVHAIGQRGGGSTYGAGGFGADATGTLAVAPGSGYFVAVGVGGSDPGTLASDTGSPGGGASWFSRCVSTTFSCAGFASGLHSRLIVAAGGGGAGGFPGGGAGGAAGSPGSSGINGTDNTHGGGGQPGTDAAGGAGGTAPTGGTAGADGSWAQGASHGSSSYAGGGGGGWYGGGAGGSGSQNGAGPGGGGGGSNYLAGNVANPSLQLATVAAPSVTLTYNDTTAPTVAVTSPSAGSHCLAPCQLAGTAGTDTGDTDQVTVRILDAGTNAVVASSATTRDASGAWSSATGALPPGDYKAEAQEEDSAHNLGTSSAVPFTVDVPPVTTAAQPTGNTPLPTGGTITQQGHLLHITIPRQRLRKVLRRGFVLRSDSQAKFRLVLGRKLARRYHVGRKAVVIARGSGTGRIVLHLKKRARRALRHAHKIRLSLVATDGTQTISRTVKLAG